VCGICGEFRFDGQYPELERIRKMLDKLAPRGPDDEGLFSYESLAFGHRRLSIIDLSDKAHQPMVDAELGLTIVFNGTIYNYPELRAQLIDKGHQFYSTGDTEVILKAFAQWGEHCVERLHGMFAFAIWNLRNQSLFLARDRMGIKPLYYTYDDKRLRFASTPQALLATKGIDTAIDDVALHNLFSLHAVVPAPRTILRGIRNQQARIQPPR
jgi:asparagine synthase (glutamine-hydrolysing)